MTNMNLFTKIFLSVIFITISIVELLNFNLNIMILLYFIIILYCLFTLSKFKNKLINISVALIMISFIIFLIDYYMGLNLSYYIIVIKAIGFIMLSLSIKKTLTIKEVLHNQLKNLIFTDALTDLPNRNMLLKICPLESKCKNHDQCILKKRPSLVDDRKTAFIYIDVDDFKKINDNLGRSNGDYILVQIAHRLKDFANKNCKIVRISGDGFLILFSNKQVETHIHDFVTRLLNLFTMPFIINNKQLFVTCGIGVAIYPNDGQSVEDVLHKADMSVSIAKKNGKNQFYVYDKNSDLQEHLEFDLINDLKSAIKNHDFQIHYQCRAAVNDNQITGLEALVRWIHPEKGLIMPLDFINLAEENGLISAIDKEVLHQVCKQIEGWPNKNKINISVNISTIFFNSDTFLNQIDEIISQYKIDPKFISLEITESVALIDIKQSIYKINALKKRNIQVLLDDFGTGYSSLTYIKQLSIDFIKIDKIFIDNIATNIFDQFIVKSIVGFAKLKGIRVISEGVETREQIEALKHIGCHEYQGYILNRPQAIDEILDKFNF